MSPSISPFRHIPNRFLVVMPVPQGTPGEAFQLSRQMRNHPQGLCCCQDRQVKGQKRTSEHADRALWIYSSFSFGCLSSMQNLNGTFSMHRIRTGAYLELSTFARNEGGIRVRSRGHVTYMTVSFVGIDMCMVPEWQSAADLSQDKS
jgi:hypothetical protein